MFLLQVPELFSSFSFLPVLQQLLISLFPLEFWRWLGSHHFLSCYFNHALLTRLEFVNLFRVSPIARFSARSLKKVPVFRLPGHSPGWHFSLTIQDCRDEQSRSRSQLWQHPVQVTCQKTRHRSTFGIFCFFLRNLLLFLGKSKLPKADSTVWITGFAFVCFSSTFSCSPTESYSLF